MADYKNPSIVVEHPPGELRNKPAGGSQRKLFETDLAKQRKAVAKKWSEAADNVLERAEKAGLSRAVLKVELNSKALAKSHRPHYLLEQAGRGRVIGGTSIGTLLVSVSRASAAATAESIKQNDTQNGVADVTTITNVSAYSPEDALVVPVIQGAYAHGAIVHLFDFVDEMANKEGRNALFDWAQKKDANVDEFLSGSYHVKPKLPSDLKSLGALPSVRRIVPNAPMVVANINKGTQKAPELSAPEPGHEYATVGILDSGCAQLSALKPWIVQASNHVQLDRHQKTPVTDYEHGTFIAGLLVGAHALNGTAAPMPLQPVKIVDARVFSTIEGTVEVDLVSRIGQALDAHPDVRVWNLSIGSVDSVTGPEFSEFARYLDMYSHNKNVLFVISSGNDLAPTPLRPWPPGHFSNSGRDLICSPADSPRGLTVGSIAHVSAAAGVQGVKRNEPTPYSRRGPAPAALPKPEVVHHGGSTDLGGNTHGGILSLSPQGFLSESHGTSYAAPLVASLSAQVWSELVLANRKPSPSLVKAIMVHSAAVHAPPRSAAELHYFGFGMPQGIHETLMCTDDMFTTFHTVYIPRGQEIHHAYPIPACLLKNGKFCGEIIITLCYDPLLNSAAGAEYCRSNVSVSMGPKLMGKDGKIHFKGSVPPDPKNHSDAYESTLIEHGFKWSPLKVYRRRFLGVAGTDWELRFDVLYRAGQEVPPLPHEAHAIVTMRALEEGQPVYRDGVRALQRLNHRTQPLVTQAQIQVRPQGRVP